jgi:hypothetical protein
MPEGGAQSQSSAHNVACTGINEAYETLNPKPQRMDIWQTCTQAVPLQLADPALKKGRLNDPIAQCIRLPAHPKLIRVCFCVGKATANWGRATAPVTETDRIQLVQLGMQENNKGQGPGFFLGGGGLHSRPIPQS